MSLTTYEAQKIKESDSVKSVYLKEINNTVIDFSKPVLITFKDQDLKISSWKSFLPALIDYLAQTADHLQRLLKGVEKLPFTNQKLLSNDKQELKIPFQLMDGLYLETKVSDRCSVKYAVELAEYAGVAFDKASCIVYYRMKDRMLFNQKFLNAVLKGTFLIPPEATKE